MKNKLNSKIKKIATIALCTATMILAGGAVQATSEPSVSYNTHVQNVGWQNYIPMAGFSGTEGRALRLEGIHIKLNTSGYDLGIEYQTHIQNVGWENEVGLGLKHSDEFSGTEGRSFRLEGIKIKLTGADADKFDILYQTHVENVGWQEWKKNGVMSGTSGRSLRLEGIRIKIVPVGTTPPVVDPPVVDPYKDYPLQNDGTYGGPVQPWDINKNNRCDNANGDELTLYLKWYDDNYNKGGTVIINPDYVAWKVNVPREWHAHTWDAHRAIEKVNGVKLYELQECDPGNNYFNLTQAYQRAVADGCIYNYVEWKQGYGNSVYPNGVTSGSTTTWNTAENRFTTGEEHQWASNHTYTDFYYCTECGATRLD